MFVFMPHFRERTPDLEKIKFTAKDVSDTEETTVALIAEHAPEILAEYFSREGIKDYKILETNSTKKSFWGAVEIEGEKFFFKFASPEAIFKELQGYRLAGVFPHEILRDHHFTERCAFYLQDYCEDVDMGNLLMTSLNTTILSNNESERKSVLAKTERMLQGSSPNFFRHPFNRTLSRNRRK